MTATIASFVVAALLLIGSEHLLAGVAALIGVMTLAVQWLCIEAPGIRDADLH
jgi:hypothetical protein